MSRYLTLLGVALCVSAWLGLRAVPVDVHLGRSLSAGEKAPPKRRAVVDVKQINPADLRQISPAEKRIQAALNQETETGFVDTPLKEAIEFLAQLHGIEILVDDAALNEEGLSSDEPINLDISGVTLRSALNLMLEHLELAYVIENEVMMVTTKTVADKKLETHVYDVRKLAKADIDPEHLVELVERTIEAGRQRSGPWPVEVLRDGKTVSLKNGEETLQLQITLAGTPKRSFKQAAPAFVTALPGCLVVRQTQRGHEEIGDLLGQLQRLAETGGDD